MAVVAEAAGAGVAGAAASHTLASGSAPTDLPQRRPSFLGRSPLRVLFRVAQVSLLLWATVVLAERYNDTSDVALDPSGQAGDLALGEQTFSDDFGGGDGPLSADGNWQVVTGNWTTQNGEATLAAEPTGALIPALATRELPEAERVVVQVQVTAGADGAGLVYGYNGPTDFNRVSFNPTFAAVGVGRVDGAPTEETIGRFAPVAVPESYEISLEFGQGELQVWIGNLTLGQVPLEDGKLPTNFGLSSAGGAPVSFDDVRVFTGGV